MGPLSVPECSMFVLGWVDITLPATNWMAFLFTSLYLPSSGRWYRMGCRLVILASLIPNVPLHGMMGVCLRCLADVSFALTLLALCGSWSLCWSLDTILFHCCHLTVLSLGHTNWNVQPVLQYILFSRCLSYTYHSSLNLRGNFASTHEQKKVNIIASKCKLPNSGLLDTFNLRTTPRPGPKEHRTNPHGSGLLWVKGISFRPASGPATEVVSVNVPE